MELAHIFGLMKKLLDCQNIFENKQLNNFVNNQKKYAY